MKRSLLIAAVLALGASAPAAAQVVFGPQLSFGDDTDLGIGARAQAPLAEFTTTEPTSPVDRMFLIGSFDWFFPDDGDGIDVTYWELNANLGYRFPVEGLRPYAGGGLNVARASVDFEDETFTEDVSDTEVGLNVLGGLEFLLGDFDAFAEARFELGGGEQFVLSAGILFGL